MRATVFTSLCAACASSVTLLRVNSSIFSGVPGAAPRGQHLQPHSGAGLAADQLHHVVEPPADDVGERPVVALADAGDAVVGLERAGDRGRPALDARS